MCEHINAQCREMTTAELLDSFTERHLYRQFKKREIEKTN